MNAFFLAGQFSLLKKRGCKCGSTTVSNIQDNDLLDLKDVAVDVIGLLKRGSTTVSNIEDTDAVDLKGASASFLSIL
ncbi:unnamed protein product [Tilletia caries]|uniref:Uncharacterized protein n=1 Tax=Tilletia controversa TaxID=13291 RepID=A0A8X7ML71_9BASI|nr:hypothetical protein A4X06_0g8431 [Tilletia controversa]CAD6888700.1 unnamed protein product [Tilletia caries]CAD6961025.1 unnamed protein product [Tilletia controversa]CAD6982031.1 unnamed protein product [Tilletia controversa]